MTYDELLKQQRREREKFDLDRFNDQAAIMKRQAASPDPALFETVKQQLFDLYKAKDVELNVRQEQERNKFLRVKEQPPIKNEKDMTDEAEAMLERYRKRQQERKERGHERNESEL